MELTHDDLIFMAAAVAMRDGGDQDISIDAASYLADWVGARFLGATDSTLDSWSPGMLYHLANRALAARPIDG